MRTYSARRQWVRFHGVGFAKAAVFCLCGIRGFAGEGPTSVPGNVQFLSQIGGRTAAVGAISDEVVCLGNGQTLRVLDVRDRARPVQLSFCTLPGVIADIKTSDTLAFVLAGGLSIVDLSEPSEPEILGASSEAGGGDIALAGGHAFIAAYDTGLLIADVSDTSAPRVVGSFDTPGSASGVAVSERFAYVADVSGMQKLDVSDPADPYLVGQFHLEDGWAIRALWDVEVAGSYAFVNDGGIRAFDVSGSVPRPLTPFVQGPPPGGPFTFKIDLDGRYAYLVGSHDGTIIMDVSDPFAILFKAQFENRGVPRGVAIRGSVAYLACDGFGLETYDVTDPAAPSELATFQTVGPVSTVAIEGSIAFVSSGSNLQTIDVSDPVEPTLLGFHATPGAATAVAASGPNAYVAWRDGPLSVDFAGIEVLDISNPSHPTALGGYTGQYGYAFSRIEVSDRLVFGLPGSGLRIFDVSDPSMPMHIGSYPGTGDAGAGGGMVRDSVAYLAFGRSGTSILDVSDPAMPVRIGNIPSPDFAYDVALSGDLAFIAADFGGLQVVDVSDPTAPAILTTYDEYPVSIAVGVAAEGPLAYVAGRDYGLQVVDATDPAAPYLAGWYQTVHSAYDVAVSDGLAYVATNYGGLLILRYSHPLDVLLGRREAAPADDVNRDGSVDVADFYR